MGMAADALVSGDPRVVGALRRVPSFIGLSVAGLGVLVLTGWVLKLPLLTSVASSLGAMKANTALGLVALGLALRASTGRTPDARRVSSVFAMLGGALGVTTLVEYALGVDLGLDELVVRDAWSVSLPGRMSLLTALNFMLLAAALLLRERRVGSSGRPAEWLALLVGVSSLLAVLGYAYGVRRLYAVHPHNAIALHTTLAFFALSAGVLCLRPDAGLMALVSATGPSGALTRRLLPAVILVPLVLGWASVTGLNLGYYGVGFGVAVLVLSNVGCLTVLVLSTARVLESAHAAERHASVKLRESETRFRRLTEGGVIGIVVSDRDGNITEANDTFLAMVGYSREDLVAGRVSGRALNTPERDRTDANARRELLELGVAHPWEKELVRKDGTRVPVLNGVVALDDARRECVAFTLDLSELKRAEAERVQALAVARQETLGRERAEHALRQTEEQLRQSQKMEAIGTLAGSVAHDFNNILSIVLGFSELVLSALDAADPMRSDVEQIARAGRRASDLTRQLLAFSRRQILQPKVVHLNEAISAMAKMLQRIIGEDIDFAFVPGAGLGAIFVDPGQLEQVLLNLVVNARDAMPRGGHLTIETGDIVLDEAYCAAHVGVVPGAYVVLGVSDTGAGMDAATQSRIFEPFFTTKEQGRGTGLGLSTVHGIVKQSGGHVWVYSEVGKGTTFKLYFPRTNVVVEESVRSVAPPPALRGTETILLVEDDEQVRTLAVAVLRRHGYRVLAAASGGEALLIVERHQGLLPLLLTDVVMPKMSGRELWERLAPLRPELKVLFMSGYTDDAIVRHGLLASEFELVQKPLVPGALLAKVRAVLDGPSTR